MYFVKHQQFAELSIEGRWFKGEERKRRKEGRKNRQVRWGLNSSSRPAWWVGWLRSQGGARCPQGPPGRGSSLRSSTVLLGSILNSLRDNAVVELCFLWQEQGTGRILQSVRQPVTEELGQVRWPLNSWKALHENWDDRVWATQVWALAYNESGLGLGLARPVTCCCVQEGALR